MANAQSSNETGQRMGEIFLFNFDRVEPENTDTGVLFATDDVGYFKTRVCSRWLAERGFGSHHIVERYFDANFQCRENEPRQAFCGFDNNPARRDLATAKFLRVMESGLGETVDNFDTVSFHTLPNPRTAEKLWPDLTPEDQDRQQQRRTELAQLNPAYASIGADSCGRADLAGKSVAVPFVGIAAVALVVAEALHVLHGGPAYTDIKLVLSDLGRRSAHVAKTYSAQDLAGLKYCEAVSHSAVAMTRLEKQRYFVGTLHRELNLVKQLKQFELAILSPLVARSIGTSCNLWDRALHGEFDYSFGRTTLLTSVAPKIIVFRSEEHIYAAREGHRTCASCIHGR